MTNEKWGVCSTRYGALGVIVSAGRIIRVCFKTSADEVLTLITRDYPQAQKTTDLTVQNSLQQLSEYFHGKRRTFNLPLDRGSLSPFACQVHDELSRVPYGTVVTYGQLAALAGSPKAARAVGRVMSANPFPLIVPCHRVVNANGSIGRYSAACGSETKVFLIDFERQHTP